MTRGQFLAAVQSHDIRPDAFSFDVSADECYVMATDGECWDVYYSERGLRTGVRHFEAEPAALAYLLERLCKDPSAKV
jgi:serine/threonine protein phosphatase PrpC